MQRGVDADGLGVVRTPRATAGRRCPAESSADDRYCLGGAAVG